jgi:hypothetical protein
MLKVQRNKILNVKVFKPNDKYVPCALRIGNYALLKNESRSCNNQLSFPYTAFNGFTLVAMQCFSRQEQNYNFYYNLLKNEKKRTDKVFTVWMFCIKNLENYINLHFQI